MAANKNEDEYTGTAEVKMGPMIDCVFLLLMYFLSAAQIKPEEKYLGLMMPSGGAATKKKPLPEEVRIQIPETGEVHCNELPVGNPGDQELPLLRKKLQQAIALGGEKQPVVIHPQPEVRQQRIVDVVNACAAVGVKNLSFFANQ